MHEENHRESGGVIRFGEYELDPKRGVLSRRGRPLKIQPQPLRVLELLLLRAPRVVTREELSDYVWGNGVNVDLEQSLNFCVRQIRSVFNDSASDPKFIDTLPKQGYRFVGDVVREAAPVSAAVVSTVAGESGPLHETVHRSQTARELSHELKWISEAGSQAGSQAVAGQSSRSRRERVAWATAATLLLGALAALGVAYFKRSDRPAMVVRSAIPSPLNNSFTPAGSMTWRPALSPDGKQVVVPVLGSNGKIALWLRTLKEAGEGRVLPGTEGGTGPFWSPDGLSIGFITVDGKLKRIDIEGNLVQILSDVTGARGAAWSPSGVILFAPTPSSPLYEIPATGGTPKQVTELNKSRKEQSHRWPVFLSDGRHFLFFVRSEQQPEVSGIYAGSLDSKEYHFVVKATAGPAFATGGTIVYMRDEVVLTQAFDERKLAVSGEPSALPDHVSFNAMGTIALFSISPMGDMIYYPTPPGGPLALTWFDRNGRQINTTDPGGYVLGLALSPVGTHAVVSIMSPDGLTSNLWDFDLKRGTKTRLTSGPEQKSSPVWQPDGQTVLFASLFTGNPGHIYRTRSDGSGGVETVLNFDSGTVLAPGSVCRNGQYFAYTEVPEKSSGAIRILPFTGNRDPFSLAQIQFSMPPIGNGPRFSPDCKWIAYVSTATGSAEVYLTHFPDFTRIYQVSTHGGHSPRWRGDGKELFYYSRDDSNVMAVNFNEKADGLSLDTPRMLFHYVSIGTSTGFDVTPDGQRFLVVTSNYSPSTPLTLVTNWNAELKTK
jgi:DNA-binding winged helix-turn-helix (wHTH) protein/Tol biopolymer transport system component